MYLAQLVKLVLKYLLSFVKHISKKKKKKKKGPPFQMPSMTTNIP